MVALGCGCFGGVGAARMGEGVGRELVGGEGVGAAGTEVRALRAAVGGCAGGSLQE